MDHGTERSLSNMELADETVGLVSRLMKAPDFTYMCNSKDACFVEESDA